MTRCIHYMDYYIRSFSLLTLLRSSSFLLRFRVYIYSPSLYHHSYNHRSHLSQQSITSFLTHYTTRTSHPHQRRPRAIYLTSATKASQDSSPVTRCISQRWTYNQSQLHNFLSHSFIICITSHYAPPTRKGHSPSPGAGASPKGEPIINLHSSITPFLTHSLYTTHP